MSGGIYVPGVGEITDLVLEEFRKGRQRKAVRGAYLQRRMATLLGEQKPMKKFRLAANVSSDVYWHWVDREGFECWGDAGFRKALLRDNPEMRPRVAKDMSRVSFAGAQSLAPSKSGTGDRGILVSDIPSNKRESKTYN